MTKERKEEMKEEEKYELENNKMKVFKKVADIEKERGENFAMMWEFIICLQNLLI